MNGILDGMLSYRESGGILSVQSIILCLTATFLFSHAVAWIYLRTHRGVSYSGTMAQSLIILSLIVGLVMLVIGNNIARAFGLFGALALIRFRTPVKDAHDTVYLFFVVAIGIATGTGNILSGAIGTLMICAALLYLAKVGFGDPLDHDGLLCFRVPVGDGPQEAVGRVLERYCDGFDLLHIREAPDGATMELSYQIKMLDPAFAARMVAEIEAFDEVSRLSLLLQDKEVAP